MKPLPVAPLTRDDIAIWLAIEARHRHVTSMYHSHTHQDRRDAELMYEASSISADGPAAIELYGIACRGWSQGWETWQDLLVKVHRE